MSLPSSARAVIVGGGVIGASTAYNLSKLGWKNIILLEAQKVTSGTTWHAAGLVGTTRNTIAETKLSVIGSNMYKQLLSETGLDPGFKNTTSVNVARTPERMHLYHRVANKAKSFGLDANILSAEEVLEKYTSPASGISAVETSDLLGGIHLLQDGAGSPTDLTMSLLAGAKQRGVQVFENVRVSDFLTRESDGDRACSGVTTSCGSTIDSDVVILCGGQWSKALGRLAGVNVPLHSAEHFYATTKTMPGVWHNMPVLRDPDALIYAREWGDGLLFGGFEEGAKPWGADESGGVPEDFSFQLLADDWDHFMPLFEGAVARFPALETAELKMLNGPESFTPDGNYILGEAPELKNFFVAAGMNSSGIAGAGGAGLALSKWIDGGEPSMDLWPIDIRRFGKYSSNPSYLRDRTTETLSLHYSFPWPRKELQTTRGLRRSSLYNELDKASAIWGSKYGWERPSYFLPPPPANNKHTTLEETYTFDKPSWLPIVNAEIDACRNQVAIFDMTSFTKIRVEGKSALKFMQRMCCGNLDVEIGKLVYTGMLNKRGGYEADVTVTREGVNKFLIVSPTAQATRDKSYLSRNIGSEETVFLNDVTSQYCVIAVMGPNSRKLLQKCSVNKNTFENENFKFGYSKSIDVGYHNVEAKRVTYVGELGFELYVNTEEAADVYLELMEKGKEFGIRNAGYFAIESMRIEKGYRAWAHELTPDDNPLNSGLMFTVDNSKQFIGKEALLRQQEEGIERRLFNVIVDCDEEDVMLWGGETILMNGKLVGDLLSATYCRSAGKGVGMGYVKHADVQKKGFAQNKEHKWQVQVGEKTVPCSLQLKCAFDSKGLKINC